MHFLEYLGHIVVKFAVLSVLLYHVFVIFLVELSTNLVLLNHVLLCYFLG
jgi:hypothetical protein